MSEKKYEVLTKHLDSLNSEFSRIRESYDKIQMERDYYQALILSRDPGAIVLRNPSLSPVTTSVMRRIEFEILNRGRILLEVVRSGDNWRIEDPSRDGSPSCVIWDKRAKEKEVVTNYPVSDSTDEDSSDWEAEEVEHPPPVKTGVRFTETTENKILLSQLPYRLALPNLSSDVLSYLAGETSDGHSIIELDVILVHVPGSFLEKKIKELSSLRESRESKLSSKSKSIKEVKEKISSLRTK